MNKHIKNMAGIAVCAFVIYHFGALIYEAIDFRPSYFVKFDESRVSKGSRVSIKGVEIGNVKEVRLGGDNMAIIEVKIDKDVCIPSGATARYTRSSSVVSDREIDIIPATQKDSARILTPGDTLYGVIGDANGMNIFETIIALDSTIRRIDRVDTISKSNAK